MLPGVLRCAGSVFSLIISVESLWGPVEVELLDATVYCVAALYVELKYVYVRGLDIPLRDSCPYFLALARSMFNFIL